MRYFYILILIICGLLGAYTVGVGVGRARARADAATQSLRTQIQIVKQTEKINAETNHTAVRDIRRVLREKYTIAE